MHGSHASDTSASVPLSVDLSIAPTSVGPLEIDQVPQPDLYFTTVLALFTYLDGITDDVDSVTVAGVTPSGFDAIDQALQARSRKTRLFFLEENKLLIITIPTRPHEQLHTDLYSEIAANIRQMGLRSAWSSFGATRCPGRAAPGSASGEGDSGGGPHPERGGDGSWPTIVIEAGYTQSIESLRVKIRFWFARSEHCVKIVLLAKALPHDLAQRRISIEQWQERAMPVAVARPGATTTRLAAMSTILQPVCIQTVHIVWAVQGVTHDEASLAQRNDPQSFNVVGGPLRLEFARLFLRQPAGPGEQDIVLPDDFLQEYARNVLFRGV